MKEKLKQFLAERQKLRVSDAGLTPSAVVMPIFLRDGEYHIIFTKRSHRVKVHKGEISFPGGAYEEEDETLLNTALRECDEEIGLGANAIEVVGELDDFPTIGSDYVISPYVAFVSWPYQVKLDPWEVDSIIEVPIAALLNRNGVTEETELWRDNPVTTFSYRYEGEIIWGASARILRQFLDIWTKLGG